MSVEEMAREVDRAIALLPTALVEQAVQAIGEACELLGQVTQGSQDPEAHRAVDMLVQVVTGLGATHEQITAARQALEQYLAKVGPVASFPPPSSRPGPVETTKRTAKPRSLEPERVEQLRGELPPPVPKPNPEGKKTYGRWVDASGRTQQITSGQDQDADEAWRQLQQAGLSPERRPVATEHAELKLAARMVNDQTRHVDVVVNNRPCAGFLGCDALLPVILPEGYSMTVHGPNYRKTFTGGKKWSS